MTADLMSNRAALVATVEAVSARRPGADVAPLALAEFYAAAADALWLLVWDLPRDFNTAVAARLAEYYGTAARLLCQLTAELPRDYDPAVATLLTEFVRNGGTR
ncbi:hypothetical protein ACIGNX_27630 [Actinosynnema sp. NPDC053489]|uniref:hypothetical protein n=1 Tax=Actinosynnema sp. NPDC053489 TaxID=3363916 RepID=UPI0037C9A221